MQQLCYILSPNDNIISVELTHFLIMICIKIIKCNIWLAREADGRIINCMCIFQDAGMWQDALRVCKEYVPHKLQQLQDEYDREMLAKSTR